MTDTGNTSALRSIILSCIPLIPSITLVVVYQIRSNDMQEAQIQANAVAISALRKDVFDMNTPLSREVTKLGANQAEIIRNQTRVIAMLEKLDERVDKLEQRR